jgi:hypothetical protein
MTDNIKAPYSPPSHHQRKGKEKKNNETLRIKKRETFIFNSSKNILEKHSITPLKNNTERKEKHQRKNHTVQAGKQSTATFNKLKSDQPIHK